MIRRRGNHVHPDFSPGGGRFHERYTPELSIPERMELAAEMAKYGVQGIEAHFPSEVNEEKGRDRGAQDGKGVGGHPHGPLGGDRRLHLPARDRVLRNVAVVTNPGL